MSELNPEKMSKFNPSWEQTSTPETTYLTERPAQDTQASHFSEATASDSQKRPEIAGPQEISPQDDISNTGKIIVLFREFPKDEEGHESKIQEHFGLIA